MPLLTLKLPRNILMTQHDVQRLNHLANQTVQQIALSVGKHIHLSKSKPKSLPHTIFKQAEQQLKQNNKKQMLEDSYQKRRQNKNTVVLPIQPVVMNRSHSSLTTTYTRNNQRMKEFKSHMLRLTEIKTPPKKTNTLNALQIRNFYNTFVTRGNRLTLSRKS